MGTPAQDYLDPPMPKMTPGKALERWGGRWAGIAAVALGLFMGARCLIKDKLDDVPSAGVVVAFGVGTYAAAVERDRQRRMTATGVAALIANDPALPKHSTDPAIQREIRTQLKLKQAKELAVHEAELLRKGTWY